MPIPWLLSKLIYVFKMSANVAYMHVSSCARYQSRDVSNVRHSMLCHTLIFITEIKYHNEVITYWYGHKPTNPRLPC